MTFESQFLEVELVELVLCLADRGWDLKRHPGSGRYLVGRSIKGDWPMAVEYHALSLVDVWLWLHELEATQQ